MAAGGCLRGAAAAAGRAGLPPGDGRDEPAQRGQRRVPPCARVYPPVGVYRQVGWKHGAWQDVAWVQRTIADGNDPPAEPGPLSAARLTSPERSYSARHGVVPPPYRPVRAGRRARPSRMPAEDRVAQRAALRRIAAEAVILQDEAESVIAGIRAPAEPGLPGAPRRSQGARFFALRDRLALALRGPTRTTSGAGRSSTSRSTTTPWRWPWPWSSPLWSGAPEYRPAGRRDGRLGGHRPAALDEVYATLAASSSACSSTAPTRASTTTRSNSGSRRRSRRSGRWSARTQPLHAVSLTLVPPQGHVLARPTSAPGWPSGPSEAGRCRPAVPWCSMTGSVTRPR